MRKIHIYPISFTYLLMLLISILPIGLAGMVMSTPLALIILLLCGLASLCYTLYAFPFLSFDHQEITILRPLTGRTIHIPWKEVQRISPLESGNIFTSVGYVCNIHTERKVYSVYPLSVSFYKLLKHWDTVKPKGNVSPLQLDKIPLNGYREPFWKNPMLYIVLPLMGYLVWSLLALDNNENSLTFVIVVLTVFGALFVLLLGVDFNYYEFTPTHFRIRSPFFFWQYEARWEDIRAIRMITTSKTRLLIICNKEYRYRFIMMGYLLPAEIIAQLQKANVPIQ